jgi:aquaporin Z
MLAANLTVRRIIWQAGTFYREVVFVDVRVQKLVAEFLGTFGLTFFGAGAILTDTQLLAGGKFGPVDLLFIAAAHAVVLGVLVTALGHISGAHFNPAVTFAALVGRHIEPTMAYGYWIIQLAAGIAAAGLLNVIFPAAIATSASLGAPTTTLSLGRAFLVEAVLTFFLVLVVYATAIDPRGAFNKIAGFAIGSVLLFDILLGGPLTGAAMNPARAFGPALVAGIVDGSHFLIYWLGPLVGGTVAALLYQRVLLPEGKQA